MFKEFKEFAMRGNVVDLAVGVIIGGAFGKIVDSLVKDIIMPPIGYLLGNVDFSNLFLVIKEGGKAAAPYETLKAAQDAGAVTVNFGVFANVMISFLIVAFAVFLLVRTLNRLKRSEAPAEAEVPSKDCRYCFRSIPAQASRCPCCTSQLAEAGAGGVD
ncbi:large conductance mechanosensitive channel protein MscL [Chitinimonas arctica]|uniref:Large-conductance mechanosensitive channel n=1 Tax=Chitinimonas arctica TaxID=2594795 RepID=A0A516SI36_9NEIS|nr:large conductance mechanosensitive channel protein MscL [Chitinimonas arctica]QDQ27806.1 large conductance mechanosensitive channel protein MscL [Chitinimonas arctica]